MLGDEGSRAFLMGNEVVARGAIEAGSSRSMNMVVLGAYTALEDPVLSPSSLEEAMVASLPSRFLEMNKRAFDLGFEAMRGLNHGG